MRKTLTFQRISRPQFVQGVSMVCPNGVQYTGCVPVPGEADQHARTVVEGKTIAIARRPRAMAKDRGAVEPAPSKGSGGQWSMGV